MSVANVLLLRLEVVAAELVAAMGSEGEFAWWARAYRASLPRPSPGLATSGGLAGPTCGAAMDFGTYGPSTTRSIDHSCAELLKRWDTSATLHEICSRMAEFDAAPA